MRLLSVVVAAIVVVFFSSAALGQSCNLSHTSGVTQQQLMSGQRQRTYRLFVPAGYDGHTAIPLVLDLHGSGGNASGQARTSGFEEIAAREGFAVASLQGDGGRWNVPVEAGRPDDVAYVSDVIDHVAAQLCTDRSRVYASGFSGGGRMSSLVGCRLNDKIAAIAPVSALRWPAPCGGRPLPVLAFHGLADAQNPYAGKAQGRGAEWLESVPEALAGWAQHNNCDSKAILEDPEGPLSIIRYAGCSDDAEVQLMRIDGLGHTWTRKEIDTTSTIWQFLKSHRLP